MASIYTRGQTRWIKFYQPGQVVPCRESLGHIDPAMADLIRRKLELELKLRQPELLSVALPENLQQAIGVLPAKEVPVVKLEEPASSAPPPPSLSACPELPGPAPISLKEVLAEYITFIQVENSSHHARNKVGCLKKFFGARLLGLKTTEKGVFHGHCLEDVRAADVRKLIDSLQRGKKTKRHHRNALGVALERAGGGRSGRARS